MIVTFCGSLVSVKVIAYQKKKKKANQSIFEQICNTTELTAFWYLDCTFHLVPCALWKAPSCGATDIAYNKQLGMSVQSQELM